MVEGMSFQPRAWYGPGVSLRRHQWDAEEGALTVWALSSQGFSGSTPEYASYTHIWAHAGPMIRHTDPWSQPWGPLGAEASS